MAIFMSDEYEVTLDNGRLTSIRRRLDSAEIPIDITSQGFCDLLPVVLKEARSDGQSLREAIRLTVPCAFFAEEEGLVSHCKQRRRFIFAEQVWNSDTGHWMIPLEPTCPVRPADGQFFNLRQAGQLPPDTGQVSPGGIAPETSNIWVTTQLLRRLNTLIQNETSDIRRLSTWPIERSFVYIDVSDFSKFSAGQQVLVINLIVDLLETPVYWTARYARQAKDKLEASMCIGDGYIFFIDGATDCLQSCSPYRDSDCKEEAPSRIPF